MHCLKVSDAKLMLVDPETALRQRIEDTRSDIEGELGMKICVMDKQIILEIRSLDANRPEDVYREDVQGNWPMSMFYTSGTTGYPKGVDYDVLRSFQGVAQVMANSSCLSIVY